MNFIQLTADIKEAAYKNIPKNKLSSHSFRVGCLGEYAFEGMAYGAIRESNHNYDYNWHGLHVEVKTIETKYPESLEYIYLDQRGYDQNCDVYAFMALMIGWDSCFALGCTLAHTFRKYAHKTKRNIYKFPTSALVPI